MVEQSVAEALAQRRREAALRGVVTRRANRSREERLRLVNGLPEHAVPTLGDVASERGDHITHRPVHRSR